MKKTFVLCLLLAVCCSAASAQNTLQSIRERYAVIKSDIAEMMKEDGFPPVYYHLQVKQNLPGTGFHNEDVKMYYDERDDDEVYPSHYVTFITAKYNFAAREFYEEYLYDADGKIAFIYVRTPDADEDSSTVHDFRLYFSQGKLFRCIIKKAPLDSNDFKELHNGTSVPKNFSTFYQEWLHQADIYRRLFEATDAATRL